MSRISKGIRGGVQIPNAVLLVLLEENTSVPDTEDGEEPPESYIVVLLLTDYFSTTAPGPDLGVESQRVRLVELDFPYRRAAFDTEKSALLVDGQQRTAALSLVPVDEIPVYDLSVNAVVADEQEAKQVFSVAEPPRLGYRRTFHEPFLPPCKKPRGIRRKIEFVRMPADSLHYVTTSHPSLGSSAIQEQDKTAIRWWPITPCSTWFPSSRIATYWRTMIHPLNRHLPTT